MGWVESGEQTISQLNKLGALIDVMDAQDKMNAVEVHVAAESEKGFKIVKNQVQKTIDWIQQPISKKDFDMPTPEEWEMYKRNFGMFWSRALNDQEQAVRQAR